MALHTIYNCTNPTALSSPAAKYEFGRSFRKIYMRENLLLNQVTNESFASTHALSMDILCLSTAKPEHQSRQVLLSADARKLNDAHNPEYMETSIMDCFLRFCYWKHGEHL
jgi:hypothetical protein